MPSRTWALFAYCVMSVPLLLNCFLFVEARINGSLYIQCRDDLLCIQL